MKSLPFEILKEKADLVRPIDLGSLLQLTGSLKDKYDKAKWHTKKGIISVCGPKFINWSKGVSGGGAIDLIMHLEDLDFKTAVLWLTAAFPTYHIPISSRQNPPSTKPTLRLPQKDNTRLPQLLNYLAYTRSLPLPLLNSLLLSSQLYADTRANAVFLLLGKEKRVVGAELRATNSTRWHGMAKGSRKDLGFFYVKGPNPDKIVLCESAIDAISFLALDPNSLSISTSGANPNPAWLKSLITREYQIYSGFDSDQTGEALAKKMIALYPTIRRLRPQLHDWNEVLLARSKK